MENKLAIITVLVALVVLPSILAAPLEVEITKPLNNQVFNISSVNLKANMSDSGNMSYKLDNSSTQVVCTNCTAFEVTLTSLVNGTHAILVSGTAGNESASDSVSFTINLVEEPNETGNETESRFSRGFQKLPKDFASGAVSAAELKNILENNQLPPGIINRLAKTGLLTEDLIDTILESQELQPPGIYRRLGNPANSLVKKYNLTESQINKLLTRYALKGGALKHLIATQELSQASITTLLETQKLNPGIIKKLVKEQTLSADNIDKLLEGELPRGITKKLSEQQQNPTKITEKNSEKESKKLEQQQNREDKTAQRGKPALPQKGKPLNVGKQGRGNK